MKQLIIDFDQSFTDINMSPQDLFIAPADGIYKIDTVLWCISPGQTPTKVQVLIKHDDPSMPLDDNGHYIFSNPIVNNLTGDCVNQNARFIDSRLVPLSAGTPFNLSAFILVKTGSVTYRIKCKAVQMA